MSQEEAGQELARLAQEKQNQNQNQNDPYLQYVQSLSPSERDAVVQRMSGYLKQANDYRSELLQAQAGQALNQRTGEKIEQYIGQMGHRPSQDQIAKMSLDARIELGLPID